MVKAELLSVIGCVDPQISVNPTSVQISSIPDFLAEQGNNLDLINPQIYLTVHNTSPVSVNVNALLTAYTKTGEKVSVGVGSDHGTAPITIKGNGYTDICLTRTGTPDKNGSLPVKVERLGELLSSVPERIEISNISAKADQTKEVTFVLGSQSGYEFSTDYEAVVPFKFGKNLRLTYNGEPLRHRHQLFVAYAQSRCRRSRQGRQCNPQRYSHRQRCDCRRLARSSQQDPH